MMRRTIWKKALAAFLAVSMMALTSCGEQDSGSAKIGRASCRERV